MFRDGRFQPVDGLGRPPASDPHVASDCRILYYEQTGEEPNLLGQLRVWDPAKQTMTTVDSGPPDVLAGGTWGPDGAIAVLRRGPSGARVTIIQADGSRRKVDPQMVNAGNTQWGATGWLALGHYRADGGDATATVFVNPAAGGRQVLPGWVPLVWSPDGSRFLVSKAGDRTRLGVVDVADLTAVEKWPVPTSDRSGTPPGFRPAVDVAGLVSRVRSLMSLRTADPVAPVPGGAMISAR